MVRKGLILGILGIFIVGWLASSLFATLGSLNLENPVSSGLFKPKDVISPSNHIEKDQIHVYSDRIVLDIPDAKWAVFTDSNSMDPVLDSESNSIEITPESVEDIHVGDIIIYRPTTFNGLIVHRVIDIDKDADGWFCKVKGDNLIEEDPDKVRFNQIEGILVGIIY